MDVDDPERIDELKRLIQRKTPLREFMRDVYARYAACLATCPPAGVVLELGSGAGFAREVIPDLVTSDVLPYRGVEKVVDAMQLPYADASIRAIFMLNVLHHIPDVARFLKELERCLVPNGRALIVDQHKGFISTPILKYVHHEPFDEHAAEWPFATTGPLSGANGALAWIVFQRDRERFEASFPGLQLLRYSPHAPLQYWLSGGLKNWSLYPGSWTPLVRKVDDALLALNSNFGSFVDIELRRRP